MKSLAKPVRNLIERIQGTESIQGNKVTKSSILGFTFLELTITLSLIGLVSAIALPSFGNLLANTRLTNTANQLQTSLQMARNHAIINHLTIIVCRAANSQLSECEDEHPSNVNWHHGWMIYQDDNGNNKLDASDQLLYVFKNNGLAVVFNQRGRLRFFPDGSSRSAGFYICGKNSEQMRHLYLLYSGRSRVDKTLSEKQRSICKSHT